MHVKVRPRYKQEVLEEVLSQAYEYPVQLQEALSKIRESVRLEDLDHILKPQPGPQELFAASPADIAVIGGSAFGGKSFSLLLEPTRHINNGDFRCVGFRRTYTELTNPGGLADETYKIYPHLGGKDNEGGLRWKFLSGARIEFHHLQFEETVYEWHGAQVPLFLFDELTTFIGKQFYYIMTRNRTTCGI